MEKSSLKNLQKEHFGKVQEYHSEVLQNVSRAHIKSFNFLLKKGLMNAVKNIHPIEIQLPNEDHLKIVLEKAAFEDLRENKETKNEKIAFPSECRLRQLSYTSKLKVLFTCSINGEHFYEGHKSFSLPIMVKSDVCALNLLNPEELIYHGEEEEEWGGYFIVNGVERIIRMLIIPRRNYPMALQCHNWEKRQKRHTSNGIYIRCVKDDQTSHDITLHYLTDGSVEIAFTFGNRLYFLPLILVLRALSDCPDSFLYEELCKGSIKRNFKRRILNMIRKMQSENLFTQVQAKRFIGQKFRVITGLPSWYHDEDIADFLLKEYILVHLKSNICKLNLLIFMTKKLFDLIKNKCAVESLDNPMHQEVLLGGHLYLIILKQEIQKLIKSVKRILEKRVGKKGKHFTLTKSLLESCFRYSYNITTPVNTMLSTGTAKIGNGLNKVTGLTVIADKMNFIRQISHFRAIHKSSNFNLIAKRKLFPEAWGFLCPVHTPDGSESGVINHVTSKVEILAEELSNKCFLNILTKLGMFPFFAPTPFGVASCYIVIMDGRILGYVLENSALKFMNNLRYLKSMNFEEKIFKYLEIVFVPVTGKLSQYPGIYIFSTPGRMMRPVLNLRSYQIELIGTMEQVYLNICVNPCEFYKKITTHQELEKTNFLSITANMIPFSDYNYSPKNIYGCQMNKQAMGISCHALKYRSDTTLYQLQYPQSPMVRPKYYDYYQMDNYPDGTNAIVAVISYSGFDMEDAVVLNKSSVQRGFTHGNIFKSKYVNLQERAKSKCQSKIYFGRKATDQNLQDFLDIDGLPYIGIMMKEGDPMCSYIDSKTGETSIIKYNLKEPAYVHDVKVMNNEKCSNMLKKILITFRIPRFPENGDKFSNRHGQKGICGTFLSIEDMPFTSEGIVPDILFNPHGFPSRMTIGMMIEVMAGKSTALLAKLDDASPFEFSEEKSFKYSKERSAVDYFGKLLEEAGYHYYSTEKMYSGFSGKELEADVFCGVVYYQRLRHMIADKFQVRAKGKKCPITQQPVQGRQWNGGIRVGEMERDALIASGSSALINDRFMTCSDKCRAYVCTRCEGLIYPIIETIELRNSVAIKCRNCDDHSAIISIHIPYVFCYLTAELAILNIKVKMIQKEN